MKHKVKDKRRINPFVAVVGAVVMALAIPGCERPDWEDPDYVARMLEEGDTANRHQAVEQLREFPEERRSEIAPVLADVYHEEDRLRSDVMRRIIEWRDEGAKEAYLTEVREDHAGYGDQAAEILGQIGATEAIPELIEIFDETSSNSRRVGILRGLSHMPDSAAIEKAVEVLEYDVDNYPIELHRAACRFIGGLAGDDPDAIDEDIKNQLAYARFLADDQGRSVASDCGLAIQQVGHPMVPYLEKLFHQENEDVERLLLTYDNPGDNEHFPPNNAKRTAAEHMSAMRAPGVVELYIEELQSTVEPPDLSDERMGAWARTEAATINEMIRGLGDIGDPEARSVLESVVQGEFFGDEWEAIIDGPRGFQMLQDSARALARLGDRDARPVLMEMTGADIFPLMAGYFRLVEARAEDNDAIDPYPLTEQLRPQWVAAQSFAYLATADDREEFESLVDDVEDEGLSEKLASFAAAFDVMDECEEVEDDADRAQCFGGFLDAEEEHARIKAALELSRIPAEAAGPVLVDNMDTSDLELREVLTFAGYRVPSPQLADKIEEILEAEARERGDAYQIDHRRLKMLHAWLQHYDEEPADGN